jgi:hypothetical protein
VQTIIRQFLDGTGGKWDWDDFISITIDDPELEKIRSVAATLPDRFPPTHRGHYASEEGLRLLKELADGLGYRDQGSSDSTQ